MVLEEDLVVYLVGQVLAPASHGLRLPTADVVGPLIQGEIQLLVDGGEEGVVGEPVGLFLQKGGSGGGVGVPAPGGAEKGGAVLPEPVIVHTVGVRVTGGVQFLTGEEPPLDKFLQVQQPRAASKGGRGHVGGIAAPRRHQGENLPGVLPGLGEEINELAGAAAHGPDTVITGQREDGQEQSAGTSFQHACASISWTRGKSCPERDGFSLIINQRGRLVQGRRAALHFGEKGRIIKQ